MTPRVHVPLPSLLVAFDFRPPSTRALGHSISMLRSGCASQLHVVHVVSRERERDEDLAHAIPGAIAEVAFRVAAEGAIAGPAWAHVRAGSTRHEIRRLALELGTDTIVLGSRNVRWADDRDDPYQPFSVLVAGDRLELDARTFGAQRCSACEALRASRDVSFPWCGAHRPRGIVPPRRLDVSDSPALAGRLVH